MSPRRAKASPRVFVVVRASSEPVLSAGGSVRRHRRLVCLRIPRFARGGRAGSARGDRARRAAERGRDHERRARSGSRTPASAGTSSSADSAIGGAASVSSGAPSAALGADVELSPAGACAGSSSTRWPRFRWGCVGACWRSLCRPRRRRRRHGSRLPAARATLAAHAWTSTRRRLTQLLRQRRARR